MSDDIGVILQARIGSTRLKGKILMPFFRDKSIVDIILETLDKLNIPIILAIPNTSENDILAEKYKARLIYRGSEDNVLERFIGAAEFYNLKNIIRVCADNPFIDLTLLKNLLLHTQSEFDYTSYHVNGIPAIKTHFGFFCEIVTLRALKDIFIRTIERKYLEHVTNYLYTNPELFRINWIDVPNIVVRNQMIRLTIDTLQDFDISREIYSDLYPNITIEDIFEYLKNRNHLVEKMQNVINNNLK